MKPYYADDSVTLYHGNVRDIDEWIEADILVTDPPYGIGWQRGVNSARGSKPQTGIANDQDTAERDYALDEWGPRPGIVFGSLTAAFPKDVRQVLIWHKPPDSGVVGSVTGFRRDVEAVFLTGDWPVRTVQHSALLRSRQQNSGNPYSAAGRTGHPHAKPLDLMEHLIEAAPPGVIADPFAGSGSTLVAAKQLGRKAIGVELEERYCEIAARRLSQGVLDFGSAS